MHNESSKILQLFFSLARWAQPYGKILSPNFNYLKRYLCKLRAFRVGFSKSNSCNYILLSTTSEVGIGEKSIKKVLIEALPWGPTLNIQNFLFTFSCWLWRRPITTPDGAHFIFSFQEIQSQIFLLDTLSIFISTTFSHLDDSSNLISHTQEVVSMFVTTYRNEKVFPQGKHPESIMHLQLSNPH